MIFSGPTVHPLAVSSQLNVATHKAQITFIRNPVEEVEIFFYLILSHKRLDDVI